MRIDLFEKKRTREASYFGSRYMPISYNMFFPVVSAFNPVDEDERKTWYDVELVGFNKLVDARKEYLTMLPDLNENWISGKSSLPSNEVIVKSKNLLDIFKNYLARKKKQDKEFKIPRLVIGPIPTGGIGVEFHANSENVLYISIHNNSTVEIELKSDDYYSAIEPADPDRGIMAGYALLTGTNRNSGW